MNLIHLISLSCLAVASAAGDSGVTGSHKTVKVKVGDDAILPCQLETPFDKKTQKVEWTRNDKDVHLYRQGKNDLTHQDKHFKGRTALFHDEMAKGNISLKVSKVNEQDEGNYTCRVDLSQDPHCNILLNVVLHNYNLTEKKSDTEERNKAEPELTTFWEEYGYIVYVVIAVIGGIAIVIAIVGFSRRNNNAAPNMVYELEPLRERNGENQRDSDMVCPEPEAEPEAEPETEAEAE
uniref:CD276 antigen-like n=1 Tax=Epinephelus lanceolatus TaxID=310571 RepID=UPI001447C5DC